MYAVCKCTTAWIVTKLASIALVWLEKQNEAEQGKLKKQQQQQQQKTSKFPEARENASNQDAVGVRSASDGDAYFLDQL